MKLLILKPNKMKIFFKLLLFVTVLNFGLISCTVQDEIITDNASEVQSTDPDNKDVDPPIEDPDE